MPGTAERYKRSLFSQKVNNNLQSIQTLNDYANSRIRDRSNMQSRSIIGPFDANSETTHDEIGMFLKSKIGPSESQIELPRKFESYGGSNSKNQGSLGAKILSRSVNFTRSPPGKVFINSNKLTAVVVRHKPVATEQYIKSKLQPYADKDKFRFTKGESMGSYSTATDAHRSSTQTKFLQSSFII